MKHKTLLLFDCIRCVELKYKERSLLAMCMGSAATRVHEQIVDLCKGSHGPPFIDEGVAIVAKQSLHKVNSGYSAKYLTLMG